MDLAKCFTAAVEPDGLLLDLNHRVANSKIVFVASRLRPYTGLEPASRGPAHASHALPSEMRSRSASVSLELAGRSSGERKQVSEPAPILPSSGAERRSTRVAHAVPIRIHWTDRRAKPQVEETATMSISCHGFRYFSKQRPQKDSHVTFQLTAKTEKQPANSTIYSGRFAWVRTSRRLDGLYLIGVELAIPCNIWGLEEVPEDWLDYSPRREKQPHGFPAEIERALRSARTQSHYQLLNVKENTPAAEVKRQFHQLALRFHPDRHMNHPEWAPQLAELMESLTAAYKTLSDDALRKEYDEFLARGSGAQAHDSGGMAQGHLDKAEQCMAEKNFAGCILWLHRAIECEPDSSSHRAMLGRCLSMIPEYRREAVEQFQRAITLDPRNLTAHLHYGQLLEELKAPSRARSHYLRVLELDGTHREARERLSRLGIGTPHSASKRSLLRRLTGRR